MEPPRDKSYGNWMVWMVHRAHLNDPTLKEFNFSNLKMPLPTVEQRVAPKLMVALENNTHITALLLPASNLRRAQGPGLAKAMSKNVTLQIVNVDSNDLEPTTIMAVAQAIQDNEQSSLEQWRFNNQMGIGTKFGVPCEKKVSEMMNKNKTITKLGFTINDANWRDQINRALLRNGDLARKRRKEGMTGGGGGGGGAAIKKTLKRLVLNDPPQERSSWEIFPADDANKTIARRQLSEKRTLPTAQELQAYVKTKGGQLPYSAVAPLLKFCRTSVMDAAKDHTVELEETSGGTFTGSLKSYTQQNTTWELEVLIGNGQRYSFTSSTDPLVSFGDKFAEWLGSGL